MTTRPHRTSGFLAAACGLALIGGAAAGCRQPAAASGTDPERAAAGAEPGEWPYRLVQSATATSDTSASGPFTDVSDLYAYADPLDAEHLKAFCRMRREARGATGTHVLAVFDHMLNIEMPPGRTFGEGYPLDDDLNGHLRAVCHMNVMRETAELHLYPGGGGTASVGAM